MEMDGDAIVRDVDALGASKRRLPHTASSLDLFEFQPDETDV